jgi:hypothetical protein
MCEHVTVKYVTGDDPDQAITRPGQAISQPAAAQPAAAQRPGLCGRVCCVVSAPLYCNPARGPQAMTWGAFARVYLAVLAGWP